MTLIYESENKRLWSVDLHKKVLWDSTSFKKAFPCLIYATQKTDIAFKTDIASKIISSGCQFVVCGGMECEVWHDVIGDTILAAEMIGAHEPHATIMTTCHTQDSLKELALFFICSTFLPEEDNPQSFFEMTSVDYLALFVGDSAEKSELEANMCSFLKEEKS